MKLFYKLLFIFLWKGLFSLPLRILSSIKICHHFGMQSREFRSRCRHLSCKLHPEIDNRFIFTLIKTIRKLSKELLNFKTKTMPFPLPNGVVNIGQDAQWNVNKHRICKLSITDGGFLEIFDSMTSFILQTASRNR
jgi:hypothetical protein